MSKQSVLLGDITKAPSVLVGTGINSGGFWFGGVDRAIQLARGPWYHEQARDVLELEPAFDGKTILIKAPAKNYAGGFDDVLFIIDDMKQPLSVIVLKLLRTARDLGYSSIALPAMRTGNALGVFEKTASEAVDQMRKAITEFIAEGDGGLDIIIVVYNDREVASLLGGALNQLNG